MPRSLRGVRFNFSGEQGADRWPCQPWTFARSYLQVFWGSSVIQVWLTLIGRVSDPRDDEQAPQPDGEKDGIDPSRLSRGLDCGIDPARRVIPRMQCKNRLFSAHLFSWSLNQIFFRLSSPEPTWLFLNSFYLFELMCEGRNWWLLTWMFCCMIEYGCAYSRERSIRTINPVQRSAP